MPSDQRYNQWKVKRVYFGADIALYSAPYIVAVPVLILVLTPVPVPLPVPVAVPALILVPIPHKSAKSFNDAARLSAVLLLLASDRMTGWPYGHNNKSQEPLQQSTNGFAALSCSARLQVLGVHDMDNRVKWRRS